jgi:hypothetical protein
MMRLAATIILGTCLLASACGDDSGRADASPLDAAIERSADAAMAGADVGSVELNDAADHPSGEADVPVDLSPTEASPIDSPTLDRDGPSQEAPVAPAECRVGPTPETPYTVKFEITNSYFAEHNSRRIMLGYHCPSPSIIDIEITSCASGYREQLGPVVGCRCVCPPEGCVEQSPCTPCGNGFFMLFDRGSLSYRSWVAARSRVEGPAGTSCNKGMPLPAGLYRITLKVREVNLSPQLNPVRLISQTFELPAPGNHVKVELHKLLPPLPDAGI